MMKHGNNDNIKYVNMAPNPYSSREGAKVSPSPSEMVPRIPSSVEITSSSFLGNKATAGNDSSPLNGFNGVANLFRRSKNNCGAKHANLRASCVSVISMPEGLVGEEWLEKDEDEDDHPDDNSNSGGGDFNGNSEIRPGDQEAKDTASTENSTNSEITLLINNPATANMADNHSYYIQTIIDLKMKVAMESSAKDELYMKLKHSTIEKQGLEKELCTVLEERNKLVARTEKCDTKSLATDVATSSSSIHSSFTCSLNSSFRSSMSLLNSSIHHSSFVGTTSTSATLGAVAGGDGPASATLSNQEIQDLLSENTFLMTENTSLTAENTRLQQEMNHLRSSFQIYMERNGGGMIDAEAGKLLFGKQRRSSASSLRSGSSNKRGGSSSVRRGGSNDQQKPPHQAATPPRIKKSVDCGGIVANEPVTTRDNHIKKLPSRVASMSSSSSLKRNISSFNKRPTSTSTSYASRYGANTSTGASRANEEWGAIKQGAGTGAGGNNSHDTGVYLLRRLSSSSSLLRPHQEVLEKRKSTRTS